MPVNMQILYEAHLRGTHEHMIKRSRKNNAVLIREMYKNSIAENDTYENRFIVPYDDGNLVALDSSCLRKPKLVPSQITTSGVLPQ